ncbi:hypothetical protein WCE10_21765, partial [Cronobacter muytjensii]|uniref:hypothetical protein n=1 Tax=Cronobacter muytjensii TaxID=413501 RepID=UPI0034D4DE9E
ALDWDDGILTAEARTPGDAGSLLTARHDHVSAQAVEGGGARLRFGSDLHYLGGISHHSEGAVLLSKADAERVARLIAPHLFSD